jgi:hypothetical protein
LEARKQRHSHANHRNEKHEPAEKPFAREWPRKGPAETHNRFRPATENKLNSHQNARANQELIERSN